MAKDKYSAVWVSYSSISDYLKCSRAYYLKNIWRNPQTGHKVQIINPQLALGQAVHEVVESLSLLPVNKRLTDSLFEKFEKAWKKISGSAGGFSNQATEEAFKNRGLSMLKRIVAHPGPIAKLAVKIKEEIPHYWLSEEDGIILCGKIDWLEYLPDSDSVHVIDFKTSKSAENPNSLQLPIYQLLVTYCQKRKLAKASYWYLEFSDTCEEKALPDINLSYEKILKIAKQIKVARQLQRFVCKNQNGCSACLPLEKVFRGEAKLVGVNDFKQDTFVISDSQFKEGEESEIL